jgi:hypothetical protein
MVGTAIGIGRAFGISPASAGSHRYWRVYAYTNNGDASFIRLAELEMYESVYSGANVLTGGTASASSVFLSNTADKVLDLLYNTYWVSASTGGTDEWLMYDFGVGNDTEIKSIGLLSPDIEVDQMMKDIAIQYSDDGSTWTTAWTDTIIDTVGVIFTRSTNPVESPVYTGSPYGTHTYWRVVIQKAIGGVGSPCSAAELEFRATPSGADQATGGTPTVSASTLGSAANIFDNNNSTFWAVNASAQHWARYQFASPVTVGEIAWRIRGDANPSHAPEDFRVQFSDDGVLWTTAWQVLDEPAWSLGEQRVFTSPDYV